jgi:hypothetical protein
VSPAFLTCSCPLDFRHQVSQMTQEYSFELLLTVSMIRHRVPRRTNRPRCGWKFDKEEQGSSCSEKEQGFQRAR